MKLLLSRFLAGVYLLMATVPAQVRMELDKLPQLVSHYKVHQSNNPTISFTDFWAIHYGVSASEHAGDHSHSDLPGKGSNHAHSGHCCSFNQIIAALPDWTAPLSEIPTIREMASFMADDLLPSSYSSGIWQPPKA